MYVPDLVVEPGARAVMENRRNTANVLSGYLWTQINMGIPCEITSPFVSIAIRQWTDGTLWEN